MEDLLFKLIIVVLVSGLALWAVRGLIMERTKKRRATDQFLTVGELHLHCKEQHMLLKQESQKDLVHVRELIEKDLEHGRGEFVEIKKELERFSEKLDAFITKNGG